MWSDVDFLWSDESKATKQYGHLRRNLRVIAILLIAKYWTHKAMFIRNVVKKNVGLIWLWIKIEIYK